MSLNSFSGCTTDNYLTFSIILVNEKESSEMHLLWYLEISIIA